MVTARGSIHGSKSATDGGLVLRRVRWKKRIGAREVGVKWSAQPIKYMFAAVCYVVYIDFASARTIATARRNIYVKLQRRLLMTTVELRKIENRLYFQVNPNLYTEEELNSIDLVLQVAKNLEELQFINAVAYIC